MNSDKTKLFYEKFKKSLEENYDFPTAYVFKFVIKNNLALLAEVQECFDNMNYTISTKESKNANYVSLTIQAYMLDADAVISCYQTVGKIKDVMML